MIVGQDFNSVAAYDRARLARTEVGISATWRNLQELLFASNVCPERCFFTNVYMGLRDAGAETGRFPGARNSNFVDRCLTFFSNGNW